MTLRAKNQQIQDEISRLFSSILQEQQKFNQIRPADPTKQELQKKILNDYQSLRGKGFIYEYLSTGRGHGPFTELVDGSVKYDLINGIGVNLLGHSHPLNIRANLEAATADTMMCGNLLPHQEAYEASKSIISQVKNSRLKYFWFAGSGSFANDTALKIIWQKKAPKYKLIAFNKAFAGRSIGMQDVTYNPAYRDGMPKNLQVEHAKHFNPKYMQEDPNTAVEKCIKETIEDLDRIWNLDPDNYCAIMIEIVQGEAGFIYGTKEYYQAIFDWASRKDIYIWIDEVQTFGRTHQLFSYQMFELDKYVDVVTIAKAFQGCGVLYTEELNPKPGLIAGTFNGSIPALNMAAKTIKFLTEGNFYGKNGRIAKIEKKFIEGLNNLKCGSCAKKIGYIGGIGTMISFEVGNANKSDTDLFLKKLFHNGVIGFLAGKDPMRVRFLLPICLEDNHIVEIMNIIEKTLQEINFSNN